MLFGVAALYGVSGRVLAGNANRAACVLHDMSYILTICEEYACDNETDGGLTVPTYAVIIPTLNEARNVTALAERLEKVLEHLDWEAVFVDDGSTDGTVDELRSLALRTPRVRFLRRVGRRGLASACVDGMMSTAAEYLAVMDADLQHDENLLPAMFDALASGEANLAVGSRYLEEGGTGAWDKKRVGLSKLATWVADKSMKVRCSDPMSGFFALHRDIIDAVAEKVQSRGFKILFDILTQPEQSLAVREFPYVFRERAAGRTKLSCSVMADFARLLLTRILSRCFIRKRGR